MKGWMTIVIFLGLFITGYSQPVLVGGFVEAEGLICFPVYGDSTQYRYLPSRGRLATTENDLPEFSFLQYAVENTDAPVSGSSIGGQWRGANSFSGALRYTGRPGTQGGTGTQTKIETTGSYTLRSCRDQRGKIY